MSTVLTAIACFLFNQKKFRERNRHINTEDFHKRLCRFSNEAFSIEHLTTKFNVSSEDELKTWLHLAIVREPVDRFLSGFVDKCIREKIWRRFPKRCNECQQNISCFLEQEHTRMMGFARGERLNSFDDRHFFPQNWRCDFSAHLRRFRFVRYSSDIKGTKTFFSNVFALLRQWNVTDDEIAFVESQVSEGRTEHATFSTSERRKLENEVRSSPQMMRRLVQMYYYDYVLFGYPLPDIPVNGDCCGMRDVFHGCCGKGRCNFLCCNCDKTSQGLCDVCCQHGDKCDWRTQPCCVWKKDDPKRCCRGTQNIFLDAPDRKTLEIETNNSSGREHALALFQKIDTNRDGRLDIPEVKAYLGREPTPEEFTSVDTNHNGFIDPHEFDDTL